MMKFIKDLNTDEETNWDDVASDFMKEFEESRSYLQNHKIGPREGLKRKYRHKLGYVPKGGVVASTTSESAGEESDDKSESEDSNATGKSEASNTKVSRLSTTFTPQFLLFYFVMHISREQEDNPLQSGDWSLGQQN
jgi:hypothetical protein